MEYAAGELAGRIQGGAGVEQRFQQITHRGATIVVVDASNMDDEREILKLIKMRSGMTKPHGLLLDATNTHVSPTTLQAVKTHSKAIMPIIKATAVVGTGSMINVMVGAVRRFSGMNIRTFETRPPALDWLAAELSKQ
jgi:hypothetical protein